MLWPEVERNLELLNSILQRVYHEPSLDRDGARTSRLPDTRIVALYRNVEQSFSSFRYTPLIVTRSFETSYAKKAISARCTRPRHVHYSILWGMLNQIRLSHSYNFTEPQHHIFDDQNQLLEKSQGTELALVNVTELLNWRQVQYRRLYSEHSYLVNTLSQDFESRHPFFRLPHGRLVAFGGYSIGRPHEGLRVPAVSAGSRSLSWHKIKICNSR